jgi:enoyl-CoA hydratase/carnithine racemase
LGQSVFALRATPDKKTFLRWLQGEIMDAVGVKLERQDNIATVILNRPERHNTMNATMWDALDGVVTELEKDPPYVVIITGAGKAAFCAGMDVNPDNPQIKAVMDGVFNHDKTPAEQLIARLREVVDRLFSLPVPIIAALNGNAYGGGAELAARCDLRVMDSGAKLCFAEVRLGLMPDWGGGVALTRLVGPGLAAELILTGRSITADRALQIGLVNRVSSAGNAREEALRMAGDIAANGPQAVCSALEVIRKTPDMSYARALDLEFENAVSLIATGECIHGITAFMSRKKPEFPRP